MKLFMTLVCWLKAKRYHKNIVLWFFYNGDNLLLQTVVSKETIEEKFYWILNKAPIEIYSEELVYVNSSSPKVKLL